MPFSNVDVKRSGQFTNFVFVQFSQRFDHGQRHVFRQTANVVMGLDGVSNTTSRFNPIGRNGSLNEVFRATFFLFVLKNTDEQFSDDLSLLLRFSDSFQGLKVPVSSLDSYKVNALCLEESLNLFGLVFAHETRVNVYTVKQVSHGLVRNHRGDG